MILLIYLRIFSLSHLHHRHPRLHLPPPHHHQFLLRLIEEKNLFIIYFDKTKSLTHHKACRIPHLHHQHPRPLLPRRHRLHSRLSSTFWLARVSFPKIKREKLVKITRQIFQHVEFQRFLR